MRLPLRPWVCGFAFFILWGALSIAANPEEQTPAHIVRHLVQAIGSIKAAENGNLSEAERANNATATSTANAILDIPEVSQRVLGRHWAERTPAEQQEFVALLTDLFEKVAYPKSAEFFGDLNVQVTNERVTGQRAIVKTTVTDPKEGLITVDYHLSKDNGSWRVRDIVLDDVSLALNLRSQMNKIIAEHSYAELLRRMREKLTEESSPSQK
jgi:phospholipid transport system substrate-binding protein